MVKVEITFHGAFTKITGEKTVEVDVSALREAIDVLADKYGEKFKDRLYDERGSLRRFVNIYVNGRDIRFLGQLDTELKHRDEISIVPAVGGG